MFISVSHQSPVWTHLCLCSERGKENNEAYYNREKEREGIPSLSFKSTILWGWAGKEGDKWVSREKPFLNKMTLIQSLRALKKKKLHEARAGTHTGVIWNKTHTVFARSYPQLFFFILSLHQTGILNLNCYIDRFKLLDVVFENLEISSLVAVVAEWLLIC